jgi:hypothetical protein
LHHASVARTPTLEDVKPNLDGVELKLSRADSHVTKLKRSLEEALHPDLYTFDVRFDAASGQHRYHVRDLPMIPSDWLLIVGEILFNLRSALDHLAWQLVLLDGGEPNNETKFPIREKPHNKRGDLITVNFKPAVEDSKIIAALNACQPYLGPTGESMPIARHPLWQLHKLHNIDKHRLLLGVVHGLDTHNHMYMEGLGASPRPVMSLNLDPIKDGDPIASFDFQGSEPPADFDPHLALTVVIDEPELPSVGTIPVAPLLGKLCNWIHHAVLNLHFRRLFIG